MAVVAIYRDEGISGAPGRTKATEIIRPVQAALAYSVMPSSRRVLLDRYRLVDAAIKVVGVGSVGRRCWIALMMSASNEPLFLQFKEAVESVLEP